MNIGNITSDNFNLDGNGKDIQIEVYEQLIEQLQQENKILKENAENNDKVVDKVNWENMLLKKENQELKKQLEENKDKINWYENFEINKTIDKLRIKHNNQQKEFIEYMNKTIEELECDDVDDEEMKGYLIQRTDTFKEILSKLDEFIIAPIKFTNAFLICN